MSTTSVRIRVGLPNDIWFNVFEYFGLKNLKVASTVRNSEKYKRLNRFFSGM